MTKHRRVEYCVIDKNAFDRPKLSSSDEEPRLTRWLAAGRHHIAVITDYGMMESVSGDVIFNLTNSLFLLSKYPDQVALTITTADAGAIDLGYCDKTRLIDTKQTKDFRDLCIAYARRGEIPNHIKNAVRRQAPTAEEQLSRLVETTTETVDALANLWERLGRDEIILMNNFIQPSNSTREILKQDVYSFALSVQNSLVERTGATFNIDVRSSMSFKFALACVAQRLDHVRGGPPQRLAPMKLRNNNIDANYIAYALIFGNFMSNDIRATRTYRMAKWLEKHFIAVDDLQPQNRSES